MKTMVVDMENIMQIGSVLGRSEMRKIMAGSGCDKPDKIECADGTEKCIETCDISSAKARQICNQSSSSGITCWPGNCDSC